MGDYYSLFHNRIGIGIMMIRIGRGLSRQDVIDRSMVPMTLEELKKTETIECCLSDEQLSELARILHTSTLCFFESLGY